MEKNIELLKKVVNDFFLLSFKDSFNVEFSELSENQVKLNVTGDLVSYLIGQHGKNLLALQHIIRQMYMNESGDYEENLKIIIDVDGYKEKRLEKLKSFADKAIQEAQSTHADVALPTMSSYERFVIHEYVSQSYPDISTSSIGEEPNRRIIINVSQSTQDKEDEPETLEKTKAIGNTE